jgi:hypothetical protein
MSKFGSLLMRFLQVTGYETPSSINKTFLDQAYKNSASFLDSGTILVIVLCIAVVGIVAFATGWMILMTHRVIQFGLMLALVIGTVLSMLVISQIQALTGRHGIFGQLVKDDYDSIYYAAQLNHYTTAANADESRWLIAIQFNDQAELDYWYRDWRDTTQRVQTLVDNAVANQTWPEESQPLGALQAHWNAYIALDAQIRIKATNTADLDHINEAERLSTGQSNQTLSAFTTAINELSAVNRSYFEQTDANEATVLSLTIVWSLALFPLVGLLTVWGISLRLKDF